MFICKILNSNASNKQCGFGQGVTWERAVANALKIAQKLDKKAKVENSFIVVKY